MRFLLASDDRPLSYAICDQRRHLWVAATLKANAGFLFVVICDPDITKSNYSLYKLVFIHLLSSDCPYFVGSTFFHFELFRVFLCCTHTNAGALSYSLPQVCLMAWPPSFVG